MRVYRGTDRSLLSSFMAYDSTFQGGVRVAGGDADGDGVLEIVTGPGPGGGPDIKIKNPHTLANLEHFQAYGSGFYAGVFVDDEGANSRRGITIKDEADSSTTGTWSTTGTVTAFARDYRSSPAGTGQQTGSASHCGDR